MGSEHTKSESTHLVQPGWRQRTPRERQSAAENGHIQHEPGARARTWPQTPDAHLGSARIWASRLATTEWPTWLKKPVGDLLGAGAKQQRR